MQLTGLNARAGTFSAPSSDLLIMALIRARERLQEADLILVCFDVTNPTSFENVLIKWFPEVKHFCQDIPVILIGCKTDLRKDKECARKLKASSLSPITYTQGEEIRQQMNAELYLECSAKYQEHVEDIFREAAKKALAYCRKKNKCRRKKACVVL